MNDIERLLALEEIRSLPLRYAVAIERRDVEAMVSLFASTARFGSWGAGQAGCRALMSATMGDTVLAVVLVANHLVELEDDDVAHGEVWARCYAQDQGGPFVEQLIRYDDTYVREAGRWLFQHRKHRLWFGASALASPLEQDAANWPSSQVGVGDIPLADPVFASWYGGVRSARRASTSEP